MGKGRRDNAPSASVARARVTAPFAGFVAKVEVAEGDQVNTGQSLVSLYPATGLEARAKLPATQQDEFPAGMPALAGNRPGLRGQP